MKKVNFADQLDLSKEIIANLSPEQLQQIEGGAAQDEFSCLNNSCIVVKTRAVVEGDE